MSLVYDFNVTTHERMFRTFERKDADRIVITDMPWNGTITRWRREGMPLSADWRDYFDIDKIESIWPDISPRYPARIIEETERYIISTTEWGVTLKNFKAEDSTPEFLDFKIKTSEAWKDAKARMTFDKSRVALESVKRSYSAWRKEGRWIQAGFWFGFDAAHSWAVGTETMLIALLEEPDWATDMFNRYLDMNIAMYDWLWEEGIRPDSIFWCDDMGYKNAQFFSEKTYCELLKPFHMRAVNWAKAKGIKSHLHSCGQITPFVPHLIEMGLDALNPLEVKAGVDSLDLKRKYGDRLVLHGGINAVLWDDRDKILAEIERLVPELKKGGGYIFSSDHSIPNSVSLENFRAIVACVKKAGAY